MRTFVVTVLAVCLAIGAVHSYTYSGIGECPGGKQPGDTWEKNCEKCFCSEDGYSCLGCPPVAQLAGMPPQWTCETVTDIDAAYPDCCSKVQCIDENTQEVYLF